MRPENVGDECARVSIHRWYSDQEPGGRRRTLFSRRLERTVPAPDSPLSCLPGSMAQAEPIGRRLISVRVELMSSP